MSNDDPYTMNLLMCNHRGVVNNDWCDDNASITYLDRLNNLRATDDLHAVITPFPCSGHAHLAGHHILCTSPAHARIPISANTDIMNWHLLPNGGAIYGRKSDGSFDVYGPDGTLAAKLTQPDESDIAAAQKWWAEEHKND